MMLECGCPGDYPDWHEQDIDLGGQAIHRLPIPMLLHMPLAYEAYVQKQRQEIEQLQLPERWPGLRLTMTGLFHGNLTCLLEDGQSMSRHVDHFPHPFHVHGHLHHGNISTARNAIRHVQMTLLDSGRIPRELYLCYLTCPHCSEGRGGERILLLRRWKSSEKLEKRLGRRRAGR
jgi:hypothetical protein